MKFVYNVFHMEDGSPISIQRRNNVIKLEEEFSARHEKLDTPTISISNKEEALAFLEANPEFNLKREGFIALDGGLGWMFGEIGIWASNYTAWKNFLETDADYLILMEDDFYATKGFFYAFDTFIEQLPEDWDMLSLHVHPMHEPLYNETKEIGQPSICIAYQDWSLACYVINRASAEKLLAEVAKEVALPPDWFFYKQLDKFNVYSIKPLEIGFSMLFPSPSTYQNRDERAPLEGNI